MTIANDIASRAAELAFGISGGGPSLEIADAIERGGGRFHTTRFEGSAALMAGAVGRLTGRPGVAMSIKGPGLANLASGLATAMLEDFPVLAVAEAFGRSDAPARAHKRLDHGGLVAAATKGRCGIGENEALARLVELATSERPGPVLLELADTEPSLPQRVAASPRDDAAALHVIESARRPVVIAGSMALRKGWSDLLNTLAVPTFSTAGAKGVVDETLPHAAGPYTGVGLALAPERDMLAEADLIIGLGLRTHEVLAAGFEKPSVNYDDIDAAPGFAFSALASAMSAPGALAVLAARAGWGVDRLAEHRRRSRETLLSGPFLPAQAYAAIAELLPDARLVLDTGFFCTIGEHVWDVRTPELYLSSAQGRSMGAALPMAVAAALCRPEQPTVLAIGDGGIGMFAAELVLAVSEKLPLLVLFMRDGGHASVRDRAVVKGLSQRPLLVPDPDWARIASAMGFVAERVDTPADLESFVRRWDGAAPAFVQIEFAPEPYRTMTAQLRA